MKFSASSLSMLGNAMRSMKNLDPEIGIEIFYEFASRDMWKHVLDLAMEGRKGDFSIHAPFQYTDIGYMDEAELFAELREPFALYHRFHGAFYVLHSHGMTPLPKDPEERARLRETVTERIRRFAEICSGEGVNLAVENLFGTPLFNQEQYIELIRSVPGVYGLIDVGHAVLGGYQVAEVQKALGSRLIGYHIHDNDGVRDSHWRIGAEGGVVDWQEFTKNAARYTPEATLVMEYAHAKLSDYQEDMEKIKGWLQADSEAAV